MWPAPAGRGRLIARLKASSSPQPATSHFPEFGIIVLVVVFGKNERDNLTTADRKAIASAIVAFHDELKRKIASRRRRWKEDDEHKS
jgi:hypothetical protein